MKLLQGYSPARIIGALNRRRADVFRKLQYRPQDTKQLSQAVLFESFHGESVSDSPLDIYHQLKSTHPELTFYWTIRRGKTQAPEGSIGASVTGSISSVAAPTLTSRVRASPEKRMLPGCVK